MTRGEVLWLDFITLLTLINVLCIYRLERIVVGMAQQLKEHD